MALGVIGVELRSGGGNSDLLLGAEDTCGQDKDGSLPKEKPSLAFWSRVERV